MLNIQRRGLIFLLSAPSGTGKSTLVKELLEHDKSLHFSVSVTTRKIRCGERDGIDYYFTDVDNFYKMVKAGEFLEYAKVFGEFYGTPRRVVNYYLDQGEDMLFEVDWQGYRSLITSVQRDLISVFILPPSRKELLLRLNKRCEGKENIRYRMSMVNMEISHWNEYDYIIINNNIDDSVSELRSILKAERLKKDRRFYGLSKFIDAF